MSGVSVLFLAMLLGRGLSQRLPTDLDFLCSLSSPCKNGATCSVKSGQIYCICTSGFTGAVCEQEIQAVDPCQPNPCQNGGTCMPLGLTASCFCQAEYTGPNCTTGLQQGTDPGGSNPNSGSSFNSGNGAVDNAANRNIGGSVFRLGSAERNLNPEILNQDLRASLGNPDFNTNNVPGAGNVASGLSNQQVQPSDPGSHANQVIRNNLKDTVILHNFLKGGLQQMLMGDNINQPGAQTSNQVNQLRQLISSPKKIQDAFPDQKLVDGNAVAVGSSGTAVGVSFKDPTQHANDLPSSFTPTKRKESKSKKFDFSNHRCKGPVKEHLLNSRQYWVIPPQQIPHLMTCPPGTLFSLERCDCSDVIPVPKVKVCKPDLINTFDYGMGDTSGNLLAHFASKDLKPEKNGVLCFNGSQLMGYPRYNGYDFQDSVFIVLRFMTHVQERDQLFPLLTNCESNFLTGSYREPSIGIVVNRTNDLVVFVETENGMSLTSFEFQTDVWNTVTLHFDGNLFIASLNGQSDTIPTTGMIERRNAPLTIGYCERYGYFDGCIDDIFIFPCIPHQGFITRLKGIA